MGYEEEEELSAAGFRISDGDDDDLPPLEDLPDFGGFDDDDTEKDAN